MFICNIEYLCYGFKLCRLAIKLIIKLVEQKCQSNRVQRDTNKVYVVSYLKLAQIKRVYLSMFSLKYKIWHSWLVGLKLFVQFHRCQFNYLAYLLLHAHKHLYRLVGYLLFRADLKSGCFEGIHWTGPRYKHLIKPELLSWKVLSHFATQITPCTCSHLFLGARACT